MAIGVFDGLHRGHQRVLEQVRELGRAHHCVPSVITFDPHPASVLAPARAPLQIQTLEQRLEGLEKLGIEQVRILHFDDVLAKESATSFVERVLVADLATKHVVVGENFHFGHNREGTVDFLRDLAPRFGFSVHTSPLFGDAVRWSSTVVREAVQSGDVQRASEVLARPFTLSAQVVHGDARGRDLGYPTANLRFPPTQLVPGIGIYAGAVLVHNATWWPAAISVGTRPQFYDNGDVLIEVHIPGFEGNLYDSQLRVAFLTFLRGEAKFDDVDALTAQIERDVDESVEIFQKFSPNDLALLG